MCEALAKRLWQKALSGCLWYADLYSVRDGRCDCCISKWRFVVCSGPKLFGSAVKEEHINCHVTAAINYIGG